MANGPLTAERVLDELEFLATVEHALIVEYLSVCCALGHDLAAEEDGATTDQGRNAAGAASDLAFDEMFRLKHICFALVDAGRLPKLGRATSGARMIGIALCIDAIIKAVRPEPASRASTFAPFSSAAVNAARFPVLAASSNSSSRSTTGALLTG
jgi:hypothetical protein